MLPEQSPDQQPSPTPMPAPGSGLPPVYGQAAPAAPAAPQQAAPSESPFGQAMPPAQPAAAIPGANDLTVDYLNQIAPKQQQAVHKFAIFGLIGGVLVALIVFLMVIANSGPPDISAQTKSIQQRIASLQSTADAQQPHLQDNTLSVANSTLSSTLTSMTTGLTALMKTKGVKSDDKASTASTKEKTYAATLQKKLDDAYQRGTLDRTYASQMTYELTVLRSKIKMLKSTSGGSKTVETFCDSSLTNIDAILKAYAKSSTATST